MFDNLILVHMIYCYHALVLYLKSYIFFIGIYPPVAGNTSYPNQYTAGGFAGKSRFF